MELIIKTTYAELQDTLDTLEDTPLSDLDIDQHIIQHENIGKDRIITEGPTIVIEDLGITIIEGVYCNYNSETHEYEPDFRVTVIYDTTDIDEFDYSNYRYFEQDDPLTSIHNYLYAIGKT